jgi:hypothetical protein
MDWIYLDITFTHLVVIGLNAVCVRKTEDMKLSAATIKEKSTGHCDLARLVTTLGCQMHLSPQNQTKLGHQQ